MEQLFIGDHAEHAGELRRQLEQLLQASAEHRHRAFSGQSADAPLSGLEPPMGEFLSLLFTEKPTWSPRYLGHMISDVSIPALLGHFGMLLENPNLASRETSSAGVQFEKQAINLLADMVGYPAQPARGHFTSGGTMANFEAFWRARYRFDHWLSMGAWLLEHTACQQDLFDLAHMGWERFDAFRTEHGIELDELARRSYVIRGPWEISRHYHETLGRAFPEPVILVPGNKHYSWPKSANVFGLSESAVWPIALDAEGRMDIDSLRQTIERARREVRPIMMLVSVAGTTELGMIDPLDEICALLEFYRTQHGIHIWHHVDGAYGGYLCSSMRGGQSSLSDRSQRALRALPGADSITLDPHKLGFVPYACGAFLVPDTRSYAVSHIEAPYLKSEPSFDEPSWSTTMEGSRPATGAGAVWLSARYLPLDATGHGAILNRCLELKSGLADLLQSRIDGLRPVPGSDTNVLVFALARQGEPLSVANARAEKVIDAFAESPRFAITRTSLKCASYGLLVTSMVQGWGGEIDADAMLVLRMVIMNPYLEMPVDSNALLLEFVEELAGLLEADQQQA